MSTPSPRQEIIRAYRALLRAGLRAVHFASPGHHVVRAQLRKAFRDPQATYQTHFNKFRILRTVHFLNAATYEAGLEHKLLKNLVRVEWERSHSGEGRGTWKKALARMREAEQKKGVGKREAERGYGEYERLVEMVNESLGLCLR
ncbi:hypothetical protein OQA88_12285 [Cercophora sp. LCS_1]